MVANIKISGSVMLFRLAGGVSASAVTVRPVHVMNLCTGAHGEKGSSWAVWWTSVGAGRTIKESTAEA